MIFLAALGWPVAALAIWRWRKAYRLACGWMEACDDWKACYQAASRQRDAWQSQADAALKLAEDWKNAALLLQAAIYTPMFTKLPANFGKPQ